LDRYYATEQPIPAAHVYRITRAKGAAERRAVDRVLSEFFTIRDDAWTKNRCEQEILSAKRRISSAQRNGKNGGRPNSQQNQHNEKPTGLNPVTFSEPNHNPAETQPITGLKALQSPVSNLQSPEKDKDTERVVEVARAEMSKAGEMAAELRKRGANVTSMHPTLIGWVQSGFTTTQVCEALEVAKNNGKTAVPPNYLDAILRQPARPPPKPQADRVTWRPPADEEVA
jgi:uncharacterized protein YdaU (DUF1376 family)